MDAVIRRATDEDADALVELRAAMFAAIGEDAGLPEAPWRTAARSWFVDAARPGSDVLIVVAALPAAGAVSSAMGLVLPRAPSPANPDPRTAHVSQVSTLPDHRRRGYARSCLTELLRLLEVQGLRRFDLHATADGDALYRSLGFRDAPAPALRRTVTGRGEGISGAATSSP